ncbi:FMN-binding protein [Streptomyces tateyamensis]|uniref:FMN-binding protein n=1 Tax=Streptomyces tateyamensis TaxID=565073 RepID=A0A2V4NKZ8_9ACTN|nr:FMN-binding protein [Streptomyces tateyamensis]PYC74017.1 FMN-binding protein [Streptomyces tateyamensis]
MRRTVVTGVATVSLVVLLLGLKPHGSGGSGSQALISSDQGAAVPATAPSTPSGSATPSAPASSGQPATGTRTVTGNAVDTRFGPVQVRITVTGGKLTKVDVLQYPAESGRDREINAYALPQLNQEAIAAGSANIDAVSGATYTSDGYTRSLQSALDQAGQGGSG